MVAQQTDSRLLNKHDASVQRLVVYVRESKALCSRGGVGWLKGEVKEVERIHQNDLGGEQSNIGRWRWG